jgi:polyhydroxyalkanoate synthesis regulator phasin
MSVEEVRQYLLDKWKTKESNQIPSKSRFPIMLRNELYAGWINKFGERHKGAFEPIISESLFFKVQNIIDGLKLKKTGYATENPDFPLRRFFFHPSGLKLTGAWSTGKLKKYAYYFFRFTKCIYNKEQLEKTFLELLSKYELSPKYLKKLSIGLHEEFVSRQKEKANNRPLYAQQIEQLKQKQNIVIQKNIAGVLSDKILKEQLDILEKHIATLENLLEQLKDETNYERIFAEIREFVEHPAKAWKRAYFKGKTQLQWFFFPKGVIYDGINCRTPEVCRLFKLKEFFDSENSWVVNHPYFKSNTPISTYTPHYIENRQINQGIFWENLKEELLGLHELKKKYGIYGDDQSKVKPPSLE